MKRTTLLTAAIVLSGMASFEVSAQFLRSSYLIKDAHYRMQLNPALIPDNGYVDIPVIGNMNFAVGSNSIGTQDIIDVFLLDGGDFTGDVLYNRLPENTRLTLGFNTDVISAGWWWGENFWSISAGLRFDIGARIPKSMFKFIRDGINSDEINWGNYHNSIYKETLNLNAYAEYGAGYARQLSEKITIGGKLKLLTGIANLDLNIKDITIDSEGFSGDINEEESWNDESHASIDVDAQIGSSFSGMKLLKDERGFVSGVDYKGFGMGGFGAAIDMGVVYTPIPVLQLSAAVNDLGFISWKKSASNVLSSETHRDYYYANRREFLDITDNTDLINYELFGVEYEEQTKSRTTSLYTSINLGADLSLMDGLLDIGLLSTNRIMKPKIQSEVTISAGICPMSWLNAAISYSVIQSYGRTFGFAVKLGPLFAGTDYMYLSRKSEITSAFIGIAIPLGGKAKAAKYTKVEQPEEQPNP